MQVAQSEAVGVVYDYGVGIAYVDAVLHNRGGEQHVVVVIHKSYEYLLQLLGIHLAVSDSHTCVGHILVYERCYLGQSRYAVVDEVYLSVARHLEVDGIGYYLMTIYAQFGLHRIAVGWRSAYDTHVAGTHQRELQGAWYRCSRHGERVDIGLQLAQALLGRHSELLFLVDDEQSEVVPLHGLAYKLVRSDEYINLAFLQIGKHLTSLLGSSGARQIVYTHGHVLQSVAECVVMLECQHRCRHQHSHLLAVGSGLEGSTYSHLGLAEAHVAAYQTIHRACTFHIRLYVLCSLRLVGRVLI